MPFVLLVLAVLLVSAPVSADYLTDRPVLTTGVKTKIDGLMTRIDQLASPNPQKIYPRIKNLLKTKLTTMSTGTLAYDLMSEVTYQVSARDGIANRTFTPHGIDWFLHDPEDFVVEDVTEEYLREFNQKTKINTNTYSGTIWQICNEKEKFCGTFFDVHDFGYSDWITIASSIFNHAEYKPIMKNNYCSFQIETLGNWEFCEYSSEGVVLKTIGNKGLRFSEDMNLDNPKRFSIEKVIQKIDIEKSR